jgi:hypothetical protein
MRRVLLLLLLGTAVGTVVLAGCGGTDTAEPAAPPAAATPDLPWPADAAGAEMLQEQVDKGSQPWLLDPGEVAVSFGAAAYGWQDAHAVLPGGTRPDGTGTPVELHGPDGKVARLVLAQPGRKGTGGVWVVTAAQAP